MRRSLPILVLVFALSPLAAQKGDDEGVLPVGADGKPLNLDFEAGTLKDWTAEGDAFAGQPVKGDTVNPRRGDMHSRHQGSYWIGTYERKGDKPTGTLTSVAFKVTHPYASFLVGGGPHPNTCVELVLKETGKVFHRASGLEEEDMKREVVDLRTLKGKEIFIRLVDKHSGHWGHINFDDFRFHAAKPPFPDRPRPAQPDKYKHAGLKPKEAAAAMTVPPGFSVSLIAGEPDVRQPIAFCFDDRGRIWVAEAYSYPIRRAEKDAKDRILIFEDTKGNGTYDKRTVFMEGLNLVSGLEVGFGGVWIGAAPQLLFVPIKDDKPGKPQVLLDGWGYQDTHETLNTFMWGPDGWLYGCHGVFTHSKVGKPGTPDKDRIPINAGIWRYHPKRHTFEVFAHGTSNPWGLDFDDRGQAFIEACVIPHNWHIIQGGRYERQAGSHFNPHTYADIKTIAEHRHYVGSNPHGGNNKSDSAGGGHAHCGTMIYLGGTWPKEWRGQMFMGNIHGKRLNVDRLTPKGSGFVASRAPDFLLANDEYARFINLRYGPDGNVVLIDWYDKQACHHGDPKIWDRDTGRIYRVAHKDAKPVKADLTKLSDAELVKLQLHDNDWYVRHSRRLLQERGGSNAVHAALDAILGDDAPTKETRRLRALWALYVTGGLTDARLLLALTDPAPSVRAWAVQLATESGKPAKRTLDTFAALARNDPSPVVRLYLASACQRLPLADRWPILERLLAHDDAADHNLPLMYWYAAEPLAEADAARAIDLAAKAKVPALLPFMIRRISSMGSDKAVSLLVLALGKATDDRVRVAYLDGIQAGLKGLRTFPMPTAWKDVGPALLKSKDAAVRGKAVTLAALFGDKAAFAELRKTLADTSSPIETRRVSLAALVDARDAETASILRSLLKSPELRGEALRGLGAFDDKDTPDAILAVYASLNTAERRDAIATLASRKEYARALLAAVAKKAVPANHISSEVVRQLGLLKDAAIDKAIADSWGVVRTTPAGRKKLIASWVAKLQKAKPADVHLGRAVYQKTCAQCHTLFGAGGKVGPDITGSNRTDLGYLMENIIDPSAVIPKEYAMTVIHMKSGRTYSGIVKDETPKVLTVVMPTESVTLAVADIEKREPSPLSMMPEDIITKLKDEEVVALVAYLRSPNQVPYLADADNAKDLFNGTDLAGWDGDPKLWKVEKGEIVGKTDGLKRNEFLRSHMMAADFKLTLKVKLTPDAENSGVQFRSEELPGGDVKGPQADIGKGWWGKLYEEHGRGLVWKESGEAHVKPNEWNEYVIEAKGSKVTTWINGKKCVDLDDTKLSRRGIFAFQLHSGGAMEVRFKDIKLEVK
jgi:putative membrane-bound dehydrogenase-like protein